MRTATMAAAAAADAPSQAAAAAPAAIVGSQLIYAKLSYVNLG